MKDRIIRAQNQIAIFLAVLVFLLVGVLVVNLLESEVMVHGHQASGWYKKILYDISVVHTNGFIQ